MTRELSSKWTFFYKFVFPTVWLGGFSSATLLMLVAPDSFEGDVRGIRRIFVGMTLLGACVIYWACMRLKTVSLNADTLVVSNYRDEIQVPLSEIERVSGSLFMSPELIWLCFRQPTAMGSKVIFMPKLRLFPAFCHHPLVAELRT